MHEVLISYSKNDKKWANAARSALEARGIRCWIDPRDLAPGTEWGAAVIAGIETSRLMLLMFSASANESLRVRRAVERAISKKVPVVACRIEDVKPTGAMEEALRNARWLDVFEPPVEGQLKRLADSVLALLRRRVPKIAVPPPLPDVAAVQGNDAGEGAVRAANWRGKQRLVVAAACTLLLLLAANLTFVFRPRPRAASAPKELKAASNGQTPATAAAASESQVPEKPPNDYDVFATGNWVRLPGSAEDFNQLLARKSYFGREPKFDQRRLELGASAPGANTRRFSNLRAKNVILRAQVRKLTPAPGHVEKSHLALTLRLTTNDRCVARFTGQNTFVIGRVHPKWELLASHELPENYDARFFEFAFAAINNTLTAYVNGRKVLDAALGNIAEMEPGGVAVGALSTGALFQDIEVQMLDGQSSQSPPPTVQQAEASPAPVGPDPSAGEGFIPLFNGKDLAGWTARPLGSENWRVDDGILKGAGPTQSYLYTESTDFKDFRLRVEARINEGGNSGVFFRIPSRSGEPAPGGYEAQINSTHRDPNKTGSLFRIPGGIAASVTQTAIRPGEWFDMEVVAIGNRISIKVNGEQTANYEASEPRVGRIGLQQHDPQTVVEFRRIEITKLQPQDALAASPDSESKRRAHGPADLDVGGPTRPGDQRTAPDRPAEDDNGRDGGAPVAGSGGGQRRLSGEDLALLKAASNWYYDNQERIISDPRFNQSLDFIVKEAESRQPRSTLARVMLVQRLLIENSAKLPKERVDIVSHLPRAILDLAVTQAMEELSTFPGDLDYHGFVENAVFYGVEKFGDMLRRNETNKYKTAIVINQATSNIAKNVERLYGPKLSTTVLDRQNFRGRLEYRDEVDFESKCKANGGKYPGGSLGIIAKYIALEYRGDTELTNVLLIGRLKTTGIVRKLEPEPKNSHNINLGALAVMGGVPFMPGNQLETNEGVAELSLAMKMFESMPAAVFNYIPQLAPGTTIRMLVSGITTDQYLAGASATLYCDQGYLSEMEVNKFGFTAKKVDGANPLAKGSVWEGELLRFDGFVTSRTPQWRSGRPPDKCGLIITDRKGDMFKGKLLGAFSGEEFAGRIVSHEIKWNDPGNRQIKGSSPIAFAGKITGDRMEVVGKRTHKNPRNWPAFKLVLQYTGAEQ